MDPQGGTRYKHRWSPIYCNLLFANHCNQHQTHTYLPIGKCNYNPKLPFVICPHLYLGFMISIMHHTPQQRCGGWYVWALADFQDFQEPTITARKTVFCYRDESEKSREAWCPWMKHDAWCNLIPIHTHDLHEDAIGMITSTSLSISLSLSIYIYIYTYYIYISLSLSLSIYIYKYI